MPVVFRPGPRRGIVNIRMGGWGTGIRQDDLVLDVIGDFEDALKAGGSVKDASDAVMRRYRNQVDDPSFWLGLAEMQWTYGTVDSGVLQRVRDDLGSGRSLEQWEENPRQLAARRQVIERFLARIAHPQAKPRRAPRSTVRPPNFGPGDCLSIHLSDGSFGAALVLKATQVTPELGQNLVGVLDYAGDRPPNLDVFGARRWRPLAGGRPHIGWYGALGFTKVRAQLDVVGCVEIRPSDPGDSTFYFRWETIGNLPPATATGSDAPAG